MCRNIGLGNIHIDMEYYQNRQESYLNRKEIRLELEIGSVSLNYYSSLRGQEINQSILSLPCSPCPNLCSTSQPHSAVTKSVPTRHMYSACLIGVRYQNRQTYHQLSNIFLSIQLYVNACGYSNPEIPKRWFVVYFQMVANIAYLCRKCCFCFSPS